MTKTFAAFTIPIHIAREIVKISSLIDSKIPKEAKVIHENLDRIHIVLFNVGVIDHSKVQELLQAVKYASENYLPFETGIGHLDYLYKTKKGSESIVFVTVNDIDKSIKSFYKLFFRTLGDTGFYPPERVHPQILLTRIKQLRKPADQQKMLSNIVELEIPKFPNFQINSIDVWQSIEHYGVATQYKMVKSFPLKMNPIGNLV